MRFSAAVGYPLPTIDIVDVGAMLEGKERYSPLLEEGLARVVGFEPNPEQFARLQGRPGPYRYYPVFLGNGQASAFNITRYPGCCSLLRPDPSMIDLFQTIACADAGGNFHVTGSVPVKTTRMDDLGDDFRMDYVKLDVQGSELEILRHGTAKLADAVVIETEVEFVPIYENQPLFGDIQCFLRDQGFVLHKFIDVAGRPFRPFKTANLTLPMSQVLWADAVFVRDFTKLETYTDDGLLKAATVLDVVYASPDLVALLLAEFDRRRGTGLCTSYTSTLNQRDIKLKCMNFKT